MVDLSHARQHPGDPASLGVHLARESLQFDLDLGTGARLEFTDEDREFRELARDLGDVALQCAESVVEARQKLSVTEVDLVLELLGALRQVRLHVSEVALALFHDEGVLTLENVQGVLDVVQSVFNEVDLAAQLTNRHRGMARRGELLFDHGPQRVVL